MALTEDSWLDASDIAVDVHDGVVTMAGSVADREAKRRAEDDAYRVIGVVDVQNNLRLRAR
jgi:osmotically-inducible protein OsmY